jgi:hypothetical protein
MAPVGPTSYAPASESNLVELVRIEDLSSAEHVVDGASELGGDDGKGLALAVAGLEPLVQGLCSGIGAQKRGGELREGPLQMRVADFLPECPWILPADSRAGLTSRQ